MSFSSASKKVKEQILNAMTLRIYEPNEIILKAGDLPSTVHFLVSGSIQAYQKPADHKPENPNATKLRTEPGRRIEA